MNRYITMTHTGFARAGVKQRSHASVKTAKPMAMTMVVLGLLLAAAVFYLFQVTSIATAGYTQRDLHNQIETLQKEQEQLQFNMTELESLKVVQGNIEQLNLVPVLDVSFLPQFSEVASR